MRHSPNRYLLLRGARGPGRRHPDSEQFRPPINSLATLWQAERAVDRLWRGRSDVRRREFIKQLGGATAYAASRRGRVSHQRQSCAKT